MLCPLLKGIGQSIVGGFASYVGEQGEKVRDINRQAGAIDVLARFKVLVKATL
jgi:hypothetical protein